jgi:hypothetical protein
MDLIISAELRDAIVNYLATRPYREVAPAVQQLMNLAPAPAQKAGSS